MGEEEDYDELDGPRSPSLGQVLATNRATLIGAGVLLSLFSLGSCSATVAPGPGVAFWPVATFGSAALALAAFIAAGVTKPRH